MFEMPKISSSIYNVSLKNNDEELVKKKVTSSYDHFSNELKKIRFTKKQATLKKLRYC